MTPAPEIITFGEAMVMLVAEQTGDLADALSFRKYVAGAECNVAIGLSRLGCRVRFVSRLGRDSLGRYIAQKLAAEGVDLAHVSFDERRSTGFQFKERAVAGSDPLLENHRRGSAASCLSSADFKPDVFLSARHLHATGIPPALSPETRELSHYAISQMRAAGRTISFDPNLRPALWSSPSLMVREINRLAVLSTWFMPGLSEGRILTGKHDCADIAEFYLDQGVEAVVIKLGAQGCYYRTVAGEGIVEGFPVTKVVDTVGAGDGFAAGYISARLDGHGVERAVRRGNFVGALAVQAVGDSEGLPARSLVDEMERLSPFLAA